MNDFTLTDEMSQALVSHNCAVEALYAIARALRSRVDASCAQLANDIESAVARFASYDDE